MIDSFHLEKYGEMAVNYNRDLELFPVLKKIIEKITGKESIYQSPTLAKVFIAFNVTAAVEFIKSDPLPVITLPSVNSIEGYGANPYIETTKPIVVVTAPGPNSGKLLFLSISPA